MSDKSATEYAADAGRFALKIARIVKAAAVAGLKGAAVETALSFGPAIIKTISYILFFFLLFSFAIFAALPNFLFGFNSSPLTDIQSMTAQANVIESAYESTKDYASGHVKKIIEEMSTGYDEVNVTQSKGSMNDYWFIAICSVAYKQDLMAMDADKITQRAVFDFNLFNIFSAEEEYKVTENGTVKKLKRLNVNVDEMDAEAIMQRLGFTDEEKNWARTIYSSMADDQTIRPDNPDYTSVSGVNYGDIVYSAGSTSVVYFNQGDSRWGNKLYGKYDTIREAACGPTSLAIVVSSLTSTYIEPDTMADWAYENGYRVEGSGSKHSLIPEGAVHFGLKVEGAGITEGQKIVDALASGKLVVAIMGKGHFTTSGHFIVLRGVTSEGKILVADCASVNRSNQEWDLSVILGEARRGAAANGPFWIISS